jgi:hypothetical protein
VKRGESLKVNIPSCCWEELNEQCSVTFQKMRIINYMCENYKICVKLVCVYAVETGMLREKQIAQGCT